MPNVALCSAAALVGLLIILREATEPNASLWSLAGLTLFTGFWVYEAARRWRQAGRRS